MRGKRLAGQLSGETRSAEGAQRERESSGEDEAHLGPDPKVPQLEENTVGQAERL